jgi:signal transduction histidine kinase
VINERKELINIPEALNGIKESLERQILDSGTRILTEFKNEACEIHTIKNYFNSILYNLLSNAIKYKSADRAPEIRFKTWVLENRFVLTVTDNGIGIDLNKHGDQMFGLYKRFTRSVEGKGLGLFMTRTQVETLGGTIKVESAVGKGTTFTIEFPIERGHHLESANL